MSSDSPMALALALAREAAAAGEIPVGAIVLRGAEVVASARNRVEEMQDISAHAELLALREAAERIGNKFLDACDLYVTLEPCPMCASAISFARIRRLYYGAFDPKSGGVDHGPRVTRSASCHHKPEVIGGLMESECGELLKKFFASMR